MATNFASMLQELRSKHFVVCVTQDEVLIVSHEGKLTIETDSPPIPTHRLLSVAHDDSDHGKIALGVWLLLGTSPEEYKAAYDELAAKFAFMTMLGMFDPKMPGADD